MTGKVHLEMTIVKAGKIASAISRLMPNVGGPKASSRKIMASVVNSIVLYAAPVWCQAQVQEMERKNCLGAKESSAAHYDGVPNSVDRCRAGASWDSAHRTPDRGKSRERTDGGNKADRRSKTMEK
jgi:hypothetical protein